MAQGQLACHQATEGPPQQMALLRQDGCHLFSQPGQTVLHLTCQRTVAKAGQIHQMDAIARRQGRHNAMPDRAIHSPSVQQHQIGPLTKPLNRHAHLDSDPVHSVGVSMLKRLLAKASPILYRHADWQGNCLLCQQPCDVAPCCAAGAGRHYSRLTTPAACVQLLCRHCMKSACRSAVVASAGRRHGSGCRSSVTIAPYPMLIPG